MTFAFSGDDGMYPEAGHLQKVDAERMHLILATILMMPLPGRLGSFYFNFYHDFLGLDLEQYRFPRWNHPVYKYFDQDPFTGEKHPKKTTLLLNDPESSEFFTNVLGNMTKDESLQISAVDLSPILAPVPNYESKRR